MNMRDDFPEDDDLDVVLKAPVDLNRAPVVAAAAQTVTHFDKCPKCQGTGIWRSYSGFTARPCYACKGKGGKHYKTSKEQRNHNRELAQARKLKEQQAALEAFKTEFPDIWEWMDGNTFEFAVSMRQAVEKYGRLTENQLSACFKCMMKLEAAKEKRAAEAVQREQSAQAVDVSVLEEAFGKAAQTLKWPKMKLAGFTISLAGAESKNAGALYVKDGGTYLGKIMKGKFFTSRDCTPETETSVLAVLADPKTAAIAYGKKFGICSCCGRTLTDQQSIDAGIGPVCAQKWGF